MTPKHQHILQREMKLKSVYTEHTRLQKDVYHEKSATPIKI